MGLGVVIESPSTKLTNDMLEIMGGEVWDIEVEIKRVEAPVGAATAGQGDGGGEKSAGRKSGGGKSAGLFGSAGRGSGRGEGVGSGRLFGKRW